MSSAAKRTVELVPAPARRPVTAADLLGGSKALDVLFPNGGVLPIRYDPSRLTGSLSREGLHELAEGICTIVSWWDLADSEGPIPVGPDQIEEVFRRASLLVLQRVIEAIGEDMRPNP